MGQAKGGIKLRRSSKHSAHYTRQFIKTTNNKIRRARKANARRDAWKLKGVKKNGAPVRNAVSD